MGRRTRAWQDRISDPSLTALLVLELCMVFLAAPLAAKGLPIARPVAQSLLVAVVVIVVLLSQRPGAISVIILGLAAMAASLLPRLELSSAVAGVLSYGGGILAFSALSLVVSRALYAPGRITFRRLQGAVVLYLNFAIIFAWAFSLIRELSPAAFSGLPDKVGGPSDLALMLYFSVTTLTTTGYGDIIPVDPLARSLAGLESMLGLFYIAVTVARLVTLELRDRHR